ncbi:non-heme iron oxygenase ferredoxin subunit [Actinomycetota bacterium]
MSETPTAAGDFVKVCTLADLEVNVPAQADVDGTLIALVRTAEREVHAVNDTCTHGQVSLSEGDVDGCEIECWLHGSRFDLVTGTPSGPPATKPIAVYPVTLEGDDVLVAVPAD